MVESIIQIKSGITINVDASAKIRHMSKNYIWNPTTCSCCKNGKYLASFIDNSAITCDKIIDAPGKNYSNKF